MTVAPGTVPVAKGSGYSIHVSMVVVRVYSERQQLLALSSDGGVGTVSQTPMIKALAPARL